MKKNYTLSYKEFAEQLEKASIAITPTELHGILTGMVSGGIRADDKQWTVLLSDYVNDGMGLPSGLQDIIKSQLKLIAYELKNNTAQLTLLFSDSEQNVQQKVQELGEWTKHYISGFGLALGQTKLDNLSKEALQDIEEISKVSIDEGDGSLSEQQTLLEQIIQHVILCAQTHYIFCASK